MPGRSGWDLDYLLTRPEVAKVIALERDQEVLEVLRERDDDPARVEIFEGSTTEFLSTSGPVDLIYLDYCSNFGLYVMQDISLMLRRQVLKPRGQCLLSFLGSRERVEVQIAHRMLFEQIQEHYPISEKWEDIEPDRRRCIAFNAHLYSHRVRPFKFKTKGRSPAYAAVTVARRWYRYKTNSASMITGSFMVRSYGRKSHSPTLVDKIYLRGEYGIRDYRGPDNLGSLSRASISIGGTFYRDRVVRTIQVFYRANGRPPTVQESGCVSKSEYLKIVRSLNLCPNTRATVQDVVTELKNIQRREGVVLWEHIERARLGSRDAVNKMYGHKKAGIKILLEKERLSYDLRSPADIRSQERLEAWIDHLEAGHPKTEFPHYSMMSSAGLLDYGSAVKEIRKRRHEVLRTRSLTNKEIEEKDV